MRGDSSDPATARADAGKRLNDGCVHHATRTGSLWA
jgi:hypothetical protein